jgi:hypothetical protein
MRGGPLDGVLSGERRSDARVNHHEQAPLVGELVEARVTELKRRADA